MVLDVNVVWVKNGVENQKPIKIENASEIFETEDITTNDFWEAIENESEGNHELNEYLLIDVDYRQIEMDGNALRYDWYSIKEKLLKLRKANWRVIQLNQEIISKYPWLKEDTHVSKGRGWHGESERHSTKRKIGHIKKKYKQMEE